MSRISKTTIDAALVQKNFFLLIKNLQNAPITLHVAHSQLWAGASAHAKCGPGHVNAVGSRNNRYCRHQ